jgi:hypothetical protein
MYKMLVTFLVFSLFAPLAAFSAENPSRARLYIPVSTGVSFEGCTTCEGKGSGFAGHYVFGFGLGLGVSSNKLSVSGDTSGDYSISTGPMLDVSYSFGSDFTFTIGLGVGGSPSYDRTIADSAFLKNWKFKADSSSNTFLGLGYNFGGIEALFAMRNINTKIEQQAELLGIPVIVKGDSGWSSMEIGIGFTF